MNIDDRHVVFEKIRFQNVFCIHSETESLRFEVGGLKSVFETLRFRDGLV